MGLLASQEVGVKGPIRFGIITHIVALYYPLTAQGTAIHPAYVHSAATASGATELDLLRAIVPRQRARLMQRPPMLPAAVGVRATRHPRCAGWLMKWLGNIAIHAPVKSPSEMIVVTAISKGANGNFVASL